MGGKSTGYLFTDIDGSTRRWERTPSQMKEAVALHNQIIDALVQRHGGAVIDRAGDGVFATFPGGDPAQCALDIQLALQRQDWEPVGGLEVRIGMHAAAGDSELAQQVLINRAARITQSAWGGQIVLSADAVSAFSLPADSWLTDLGFCHLKDIDEPMRLFSLSQRDLVRTEFPPPRTSTQQGTLAASFTALFGRERECRELTKLLEDESSRIVSLVGAGGNGKTRLAAQVGHLANEQLAVWFVSLETASSGTDLAAAVARALRLPLHGPAAPLEQVTSYLASRRGLLILDNVDSVTNEAGAFIFHVRSRCIALRVLTTSRAPLSIAHEKVYRVSGLPAPGPSDNELIHSPASQLFIREARVGRPGFVLEKDEYASFRELCAVVNGSPLALRLAAQWRRVLPVSEILARVRNNLDFLQTNETGTPDRHRSIRGVFEGSWAMLSDEERSGLMRLSIFVGGFDALGAEGAGGLALTTLLDLEQKGLVERLAGDRFAMHPLIRGYARERLAASPDAERNARARHADYYLDLAKTEFASASPAGRSAPVDRIEQENDNVLAAWRHTIERKAWDKIESAAEPLFYALVLRARYRDAVEFFRQTTGHDPIDSYLAGLLANCVVQQGELEEAARLAHRGMQGDIAALARAHVHQALGLIAHARGQVADARKHYEDALAIRRAHADYHGCFYSVAALAILHMLREDGSRARDMIKESFWLCEQTTNRTGLMIVHSLAGDLAAREGRMEDAKAGYTRSLELEQQVHHPQHRARVLTKLGGLMTDLDEHSSAMRYHREAFACAAQIGDVRHKIEALLAIAGDLRKLQQDEKAKLRVIQAMRLTLQLGARPLLIRCLLDLARLEAGTGNDARAERLLSVLSGTDLGAGQSEYDALVARLPEIGFVEGGHTSPETLVNELVSEAELETLRL